MVKILLLMEEGRSSTERKNGDWNLVTRDLLGSYLEITLSEGSDGMDV